MAIAASDSLTAILRCEIEERGPMPLARWMETALYHPEFGYYRGGRNRFGKRGDFFTAEQLDPFAAMLTSVVTKLMNASGNQDEFGVLELGAGRQDLRQTLSPFRYLAHDWDCPPLPESHAGLILAHEFFDAMPVRVLRRNPDRWVELAVGQDSTGFHIAEAPWTLEPGLLSYANRYGSLLPVGSLLEVNQGLAEWIAQIGRRLRSGSLLVFDYGYMAEELPRLSHGTLMSYQRHVALNDILEAPGERDITAHVNFSELIAHAERNGLHLESNLTLREWALQIWSNQELEERWREASLRWRLQWKQVVFGMGDVFRVLHFARQAAKLCP